MNPPRNGDAPGPLKSESAENYTEASSEHFSPRYKAASSGRIVAAIGFGAAAIVAAIVIWMMSSH
jgi:hypothetical protein